MPVKVYMESGLLLAFCLSAFGAVQVPRFRKVVLDDNFPGGYQVKVADVDGDGRPDVLALGETPAGQIAWYKNPSWKRYPISVDGTKNNIDLAVHDIDGDGELEIAVASEFQLRDSTSGGTISWLKRRESLEEPWRVHRIDAEPTAHRVRWADVDGDGRKELICAPILGSGAKAPRYDQAPARLILYRIPPKNPSKTLESPLMTGIAAYVARLDKDDAQFLRALADFKKEQVQLRESGWKPPWEGLKHLKSRSDYEKLSTADLARECFSTSLWARETLIYDDPRYGVARAAIFHHGFSVLYERPDFWNGIASVYKDLSRRLEEAKGEKERMDILFNLQTLQHAYTYPLFRGRLKGREKLLLRANLVALRAVLSYTKQAKEPQGQPFWGAGVAYGLSCPTFALLKRTDPEKYSNLLDQLESTQLSFAKPDPGQVESYIGLVISGVEQALERWPKEIIDETLHITHALEAYDFDGDGRDELLTGSFEGVHLFDLEGKGEAARWRKTRLCRGNQAGERARGSSEVCVGRLRGGTRFIATIEPWHGNEVVVYLPPGSEKGGNESSSQTAKSPPGLWERHVLDDSLSQGHALCSADFNGDGCDEVIAGFRGRGGGIYVYCAADESGTRWEKSILDEGGIAAQGFFVFDISPSDLSGIGDGRPDLAAVGGATHNVHLYLNVTTPASAGR